jgi:hypothetical protein
MGWQPPQYSRRRRSDDGLRVIASGHPLRMTVARTPCRGLPSGTRSNFSARPPCCYYRFKHFAASMTVESSPLHNLSATIIARHR